MPKNISVVIPVYNDWDSVKIHVNRIAQALAYLDDYVKPDFAAVIYGDGVDAPADLPKLLKVAAAFPGPGADFTERGKRAEGLLFRFFYLTYILLHRLLTGHKIRFGNYSVINAGALAAAGRGPF